MPSISAAAALLLAIAVAAAYQASVALAMPPEWNLPGLPAAWGAGAGGNHRCVPIPASMQLCSGIGYAEMRLPNMLNHESPKEVQDQTEHWLPLVNTACHREIRVLLCSIYAPVCIKHLPEKSIKPCRTLCQSVKDSCLVIMEKFGFAWPDMLNCAQFPPEHDLMCIKRSVSLTNVAAHSNSCQICTREPTYESLVSGYCLNDIVIKARIDKVSSSSSAVATGSVSPQPSSAPRHQVFQLKGKLRYFSSARLQLKRDRRQQPSGRLACSSGCQLLEEAAANPKRRYLIMGSVSPDGSSLDVKLLAEWNPRLPAFRRAVRSFRRETRQQLPKEQGLCRGGQGLLQIKPPSAAAGGSGGLGGGGSLGGSSGGSGSESRSVGGSGSESGSVGGSESGGGGESDGGADGRRRRKRKGNKKKDRRRGAAGGRAVPMATVPASEA